MEEEDGSSPIPIPRGMYNFNFDDVDENTNPFQTKSALSQSPGSTNNPFQTKSKLGQSPPISNNNIYDIEDPFKSKNKLSSSPPPNQDLSSPGDTNSSSQNNAISQSPKEDSVSASTSLSNQEQTSTKNTVKNEDIAVQSKQPSKKTTVKKGIKKPKIKTKFKPPENFGAQGGDDIQIFVPTKESSPPAPPTEMEEPPDMREVVPDQQLAAGTESGDMESANHMSQSLEVMHDFGAGEMPDSDENEGFVPANEVFTDTADWEMLEKFGNKPQDELEQDSLYTKFDPLLEKPAKIVPDTNQLRNENSEDPADQSEDLLLMTTPPSNKTSRVPKHPAARVLEEQVEENGNSRKESGPRTIDKMLFSPTNNTKLQSPPDEIDGNKYYDAYEFPPTAKSHYSRGSKSDGVGDRSGYKMENTEVVQLVQVLKYSQSEWNKMKQDLELEFQAKLLNKEREWSRKLADREKNLSHLEEQNKNYKQANHDMRCVVAEFEKTIAQLQAEKEKSSTESQQSLEDIVKERDQALEDLQSVEMAFSDLHRRYEKMKGVVEGFKKNEEVLKKCVQDYQSKLKKSEEKLQSVKQQAEEKLDLANLEIEKVRKTTTADVARLEAAMRKSDLRVAGLEKTLEHKVKENQELTAICDELIAKVGSD